MELRLLPSHVDVALDNDLPMLNGTKVSLSNNRWLFTFWATNYPLQSAESLPQVWSAKGVVEKQQQLRMLM